MIPVCKSLKNRRVVLYHSLHQFYYQEVFIEEWQTTEKKELQKKKKKKKRIVQYFYAATPVDNTSTHVRVCNCAILEHKLQKMKQFVHSTLAPLVRQEKVTDGL